MLNVLLGCNLGLGLLLEVQLHRLYFLVTSSGFVGRIFQRADLGLRVPRQLHLLDLQKVLSLMASCSLLIFCCGLCPTDHPALYPITTWIELRTQYDSLLAERSGNRILVEVGFSAPAQTNPGAHPASCMMGTESLSWG